MGKLSGQTAIVTGAGQGIGLSIAQKLAAEGANVVANDLDEATCREVVDGIVDQGGAALAVPGDVTEANFGERAVNDALALFGDVHIIINNAGYIWNTSALNHTDEQWAAMIDMHLTAPFRLLRAAGAHFRNEAKRLISAGEPLPCRKIVNISSVSGIFGAATQVSYSAAKSGVVGMTKTLAKEWGRYNVTVNAVAFGHIATRLTQPYEDAPEEITIGGRAHKVGLTKQQVTQIQEMTPLGRTGTPDDAAGAVVLFCYPESNFVSGQILVASGGLEM